MGSGESRGRVSGFDYYLSILLVGLWSFSALYFEILESKLLQFFRVYGHPLFIVAVAMLGTGVGGLLVYARKGYQESMVRASLLLQGPALVLAMLVPGIWPNPVIAALVLAAVFFLYSLLIGTYFVRENSYRIYFCNLIGSAAGIASVYFLLPALGGERSILILSCLLLLVGLIYLVRQKAHGWAAAQIVLLVPILVLLGWDLKTSGVDIINLPVSRSVPGRSDLEFAGKASRLPGAKVLATRTNLVARVDVIETPGHNAQELFFPEGTATIENPLLRKEAQLDYNSEIQLYANNTFFSSVASSDKLYTDLPPYSLLRNPSVLVIGPGGGIDIARAKYMGAKRIVGVEINSTVISLMRGLLHQKSNGVYDGVEIFQMDGRSYLESRPEQFDLINLVFVDLYIPFYNSNVFMENYLYTQEAFTSYLEHLSPGGILSLTKMIGSLNSPSELLRIFSTLLQSLKDSGVSNPQDRLVVLGFGDPKKAHYAGIILAKKTAFTSEELASIKSVLTPPLFALYIPGEKLAANPFQELALTDDPENFFRHYPLWVSPTTDNRPFFYLFDKSLAMHKGMIVEFSALALIVFFIPSAFLISRRRAEFKGPGAMFALYFALLGAGYMLIETVLVQRFNLYLGGAVYSLSLVVGALLLFAGLGSMAGARLSTRTQLILLFLLPFIALAYALPVELGVNSSGFNLFRRALASLAFLFPLCFLIGLPFPLGLKLAGERLGRGVEPFLFGLNSIFCTLTVVVSLYISARFGLRVLFFGAAGSYFAAAILLIAIYRKK
jgi:hypothetical protein